MHGGENGRDGGAPSSGQRVDLEGDGRRASQSLLLVNGRVLTQDPLRPVAQAVELRCGHVRTVGGDGEVRDAALPGAIVVDCAGRTVLPGFVDAHVHLLALARTCSSVDLSPGRVGSIDDVVTALRARARDTVEGAWVRGHGYDEHFLRERRHPSRHDLDRASPDRPVRIRHRTRHATVLNSVAMARVACRAPELLRADGVERAPSSGEPTGVLYGLDGALSRLLPRPPREETIAALARASTDLLATGITAVDDATASTGAAEVALFREAIAAGAVRQRVRLLWGAETHGLPEDPSITAVKIMAPEDGSAPSRFADLLLGAHRRGLQVAVHAVEGPAIAVALSAFDEALRRWPRIHRHRLEHCALCPPPLMDEVARLRLSVVTQPGFLGAVGDRYAREVPAGEHAWLYPLRSLRARGIRVAASSDAPVGPSAPMMGIAGAVTRTTSRGRVLAPREALRRGEALELYGSAAAWVAVAEGTSGRIAPGMPADLVVLGDDLDRVPAERLGRVPVWAVIKDGTIVCGLEGGAAPSLAAASGGGHEAA